MHPVVEDGVGVATRGEHVNSLEDAHQDGTAKNNGSPLVSLMIRREDIKENCRRLTDIPG